jgi:N utilization substance protein A
MTDDTAAIRELLTQVIPEVANGSVQIRGIARESGVLTKVALLSRDSSIDCIAACVGYRGSRIKQIVEQLNKERIDLVRWSEPIETFITNALQPIEVLSVTCDHLERRATAYVQEDQTSPYSMAQGWQGKHRRLASALCGIEIEIVPLRKSGETE